MMAARKPPIAMGGLPFHEGEFYGDTPKHIVFLTPPTLLRLAGDPENIRVADRGAPCLLNGPPRPRE
jgi:hypothetical protein